MTELLVALLVIAGVLTVGLLNMTDEELDDMPDRIENPNNTEDDDTNQD